MGEGRDEKRHLFADTPLTLALSPLRGAREYVEAKLARRQLLSRSKLSCSLAPIRLQRLVDRLEPRGIGDECLSVLYMDSHRHGVGFRGKAQVRIDVGVDRDRPESRVNPRPELLDTDIDDYGRRIGCSVVADDISRILQGRTHVFANDAFHGLS